jgi:two-component system sensor histidine kinase/response regulator
MENSGKEKPLVLIVDDVAKNIQVLAALLYQENYEIAMADSGTSALSMLDEGLVPDLILLDVMMPDLDGFETCRRIKIKELLKDVPVIFLTARHETESIVKGFEIGAADYVTKPFNSHELISRVNTHLQLKNKTEQLRNFNELLESKVKERTIELTKANKRLEKLDKAKSYFLDLLSHELITPISGIEGFAKMLKPSLLDEEQLEYADLIIESADRLKKFSDMSRLITMLKSENYRKYDETINLKSLLEESIFDMKDTIRQKKR